MTPVLAAYLHLIDPYVVELWDGGPIRWYGLSYLAGFLLGYLIVRWLARIGASTLKGAEVGDLVIAVAIGIVLGGRFGYIVFYQPGLLVRFTGEAPFWGLLAVNEGGMASHGGMLGGLVGCWWFARRRGHRLAHVLDLLALGATPGLFLGRVANFVNGELLGRPCAAGFRWGVKFPQEMFDWGYEEFARLEAALSVAPAVLPASERPLYSRIPEMIEWMRSGNLSLVERVEPLLAARHPSQLYAAALEGLVLFLILGWFWRKPRRPGVVVSVFCVAYGVLRIVGEFFREPDAHLGLQWLDMTRGQWLSVGLMGLGVVLLWLFARGAGEKIGGWWGKRGVSE